MDYSLGLLVLSGVTGVIVAGLIGHLRGRMGLGMALGLILGPILGSVAIMLATLGQRRD